MIIKSLIQRNRTDFFCRRGAVGFQTCTSPPQLFHLLNSSVLGDVGLVWSLQLWPQLLTVFLFQGISAAPQVCLPIFACLFVRCRFDDVQIYLFQILRECRDIYMYPFSRRMRKCPFSDKFCTEPSQHRQGLTI